MPFEEQVKELREFWLENQGFPEASLVTAGPSQSWPIWGLLLLLAHRTLRFRGTCSGQGDTAEGCMLFLSHDIWLLLWHTSVLPHQWHQGGSIFKIAKLMSLICHSMSLWVAVLTHHVHAMWLHSVLSSAAGVWWLICYWSITYLIQVTASTFSFCKNRFVEEKLTYKELCMFHLYNFMGLDKRQYYYYFDYSEISRH